MRHAIPMYQVCKDCRIQMFNCSSEKSYFKIRYGRDFLISSTIMLQISYVKVHFITEFEVAFFLETVEPCSIGAAHSTHCARHAIAE